MSKLYASSILLLLVLFLNAGNAFSQIVINGPRPKNLYKGSGGELYVSLAYGYNFWRDKKQRAFPGSSASMIEFNFINDIIPISIDKFDYSQGLSFGIEKRITDAFGIKAHLFHAKMYSGLSTRSDLEVEDKSKFSQVGIYGSLTLTKDKDKKLQFHWLLGPELILAKKDVLIKDYMENEKASPVDYHYQENVTEGAVVTGLSLSFRIAEKFTLYSDGLAGISLPGTGIKVTSHNIGLKYKMR